MGNNPGGFLTAGQTSGVSYTSLSASAGGRKILVDESFGLSSMSDTWSNQTAATINARISEGVIAANLTAGTPAPPTNSPTAVPTLRPQLNSICP